MNTMTVTVDQNEGRQLYFTIEFKNEDFMKVVDSIGELTVKSVYGSKLWKVI